MARWFTVVRVNRHPGRAARHIRVFGVAPLRLDRDEDAFPRP